MTKKLTGTLPYQTPLNADLGTMAYQDADSVRVGSLISDGSVEIGINRTSSTSGIVLQLSDNVTGAQTDGVYKAIRSASNAGNSISEIRFLETDGTNNNTSISFATANTAGGLTERLRINQAGKVGIGTDDPTATLDVVGTNATEQLRVGNSTGGTDFGITVAENSGVTLNSAEGTSARNMIFAIGGTPKVEIGADGYVNKFVLYGKSDYSNTYTYTQGGFGTLYTTLIPPGNLNSNSIYLITIKTVFEASPYYADTSFIFTTCPGTNGAGAGSAKDFLTSNHVNSANVYWSIRTTTGASSTNGIQGLCNNAPVAGFGVPTVKVYAQKIGFVS